MQQLKDAEKNAREELRKLQTAYSGAKLTVAEKDRLLEEANHKIQNLEQNVQQRVHACTSVQVMLKKSEEELLKERKLR